MTQNTQNAGQAQNLMTDKEAAIYLNLAVNTLAVWRCTKREALPFIKLGRAVRYRKSDLDNWLNANTVGVTA